MNSTLTAVLSVGGTQHVCVCAAKQAASPLTCVLHLPGTLTGCDTAGAGQHRLLIRSAPSRPADVAVAQNNLPPSCAKGPGPAAHPASRSMTSPSLFVTVMIRPAADENTTLETGVRWPKQARHTSHMVQLCMGGEEFAVAAPARPSGRDGVMGSPPPPRRRWGCWKVLDLELPFTM